MSRHNYNQYSNYNKHNRTNVDEVDTTPVVADEIKIEDEVHAIDVVATPDVVETALVQETVNTVTLSETVTGVVVNCAKLNVRAEASADADIICVLPVNTEITVNADKSNNEWVNVCTATGVEGYCMKKYVDVRL